MATRTKFILAVLGASVVGLAITVAALALGEDHGGNATMANDMMGENSAYAGMVGLMGSMGASDPLQHMREVLGDAAYQRMLTHMADHGNGTPMNGNAALDQMMVTMMHGMMRSVPASSVTDSPSPSTTPVP